MYVEWKVIQSHILIALPHLKHRIAVQGGACMDFINLSDIFHIYEACMNPAFSRNTTIWHFEHSIAIKKIIFDFYMGLL